ncbi:MAG: hypothetical protein Q8M40_03845 [Legionella sp.]|nr:hypothetical protein [Legionella sp.]
MINKSCKKALILSISVLSLNASADILASKENLTRQCRDLSLSVASLISSQERHMCSEKLSQASGQIDRAGNSIIDDAYPVAKQELDSAVLALQFAQLNSCNRYIQISHSKFEAQKIKNSL